MSVFRDQLHVDEPSGERFSLALDLLASGETVVYRGLALAIRSDVLQIDVPSTWRSEHVTQEHARRDLDRAAEVIDALAESSSRFRSLTGRLPRRLLLIEDYGNGAIALAELKGNAIHWRKGFGPPGA